MRLCVPNDTQLLCGWHSTAYLAYFSKWFKLFAFNQGEFKDEKHLVLEARVEVRLRSYGLGLGFSSKHQVLEARVEVRLRSCA